MSVIIFRSRPSASARALAASIEGAIRARSDHRVRLLAEHHHHLVAWGSHFPAWAGGPQLNNRPVLDKLKDAIALRDGGIPTIEISREQPNAEGWLPRLRHHVGGNDLLGEVTRPDFWVKKEHLVAEYRVHSFLGASIRAGKKKPVEGYPVHPWIRSLQSGWKISYDGASVRQCHRDLSHRAVEALGLDFGAVDLGERADGSLMVLEVNRAPGVEGGTIAAYARAIQKWAQG